MSVKQLGKQRHARHVRAIGTHPAHCECYECRIAKGLGEFSNQAVYCPVDRNQTFTSRSCGRKVMQWVRRIDSMPKTFGRRVQFTRDNKGHAPLWKPFTK